MVERDHSRRCFAPRGEEVHGHAPPAGTPDQPGHGRVRAVWASAASAAAARASTSGSSTHAPAETPRKSAPSSSAPAARKAARDAAGGAVRSVPRDAASKATPDSARGLGDRAPVPARAFSGRIVALALVLVAVTIMLAPTVRVFFSQRAEIQSIQADIAAKQSDQANLKQEISRWQDPAYVQQQARDRINMVMPGETSYWVFGDAGTQTAQSGSTAGSSPQDVPWTQALWDSVRRAATE
ncbi:FtsB family cell division protein [Sinomonas sp. P47F7]|uniref:FtsB family cell division protein n=1 Tax=Sinomonas sp. P47F7 TaxID=3410987 RepID=UPI003BF5FF25